MGAARPEEFEATELGAPFLARSTHSVGLSHTGEYIGTVVYARNQIVGIDIEFASREVDGIISHHDADLALGAISAGVPFPPVGLFCAKEAAGKALGIGLLAVWDVYALNSLESVSVRDTPLWRIEYKMLPFLVCYVTVVDTFLVVACVVAKRTEEYAVRQAFADLENLQLRS